MRKLGEGNGKAKGMIDYANVTPDCVLFLPNPQRPPKDDELPAALAEVLQKWLIAEPGFRVRDTLSEMFHPHWHKPARF